MVSADPGSVARLVTGRLRHSLESTHWNGVLEPVRNGDNRLEVAVIKLLPSSIHLNLQSQEQVCCSPDANGLRRRKVFI